ncbi:MAG: hypothetical protein K2Y71_23950 [Xanthobacteraceae bacterium]|nr:hypothetical protein [Xanthobacteraceae bacterium]
MAGHLRFTQVDMSFAHGASNPARLPAFDQISLVEWEAVLRVNVTGVLCARTVVGAMQCIARPGTRGDLVGTAVFWPLTPPP